MAVDGVSCSWPGETGAVVGGLVAGGFVATVGGGTKRVALGGIDTDGAVAATVTWVVDTGVVDMVVAGVRAMSLAE